LRFFPARQVFEIINEFSKNTENTLIELERDHKVFYENQSIRGFFGIQFSFQNCFWNLFSNSGLSEICKIRNVWQLSNYFSRNTLITSSEKTSGVEKRHFGRKIVQ
jgi:hypothetical protein